MGGALQTLAEEPFGQWLLVAFSVGLVAYAIYLFILAWFQRIRIWRSQARQKLSLIAHFRISIDFAIAVALPSYCAISLGCSLISKSAAIKLPIEPVTRTV